MYDNVCKQNVILTVGLLLGYSWSLVKTKKLVNDEMMPKFHCAGLLQLKAELFCRSSLQSSFTGFVK